MPVVRFISLLANGQSDTQWFPRHLHDKDYEYFGLDHDDLGVDIDEYVAVDDDEDDLGVDDGDDDDDDDEDDDDDDHDDDDDDPTCCTSNVAEALRPLQMLFGPEIVVLRRKLKNAFFFY